MAALPMQFFAARSVNVSDVYKNIRNERITTITINTWPLKIAATLSAMVLLHSSKASIAKKTSIGDLTIIDYINVKE